MILWGCVDRPRVASGDAGKEATKSEWGETWPKNIELRAEWDLEVSTTLTCSLMLLDVMNLEPGIRTFPQASILTQANASPFGRHAFSSLPGQESRGLLLKMENQSFSSKQRSR